MDFDRGQASIPVLNLSSQPIVLREGLSLGQWECLAGVDEEVLLIEPPNEAVFAESVKLS